MYYYFDNANKVQGPFSERAYEKWYDAHYFPAGIMLYDENNQKFPIEDVITKSMKSRAKVMFQDTMILEETIDQTNLDVTLNMDHSYEPNETTYFHPDFTQIDEEVDEVDTRKSEKYRAEYKKSMNLYIEQRALLNYRRRIPDTYVPFENYWSSWMPLPMSRSDAMRRTAHLHNILQEFNGSVFSNYLEYINILPHPCQCCRVEFENSFEMLLHFVSIPHLNRLFSVTAVVESKCLSMLDVFCVQKMIDDVESIENANSSPIVDGMTLRPEPSYFDGVDITMALESLKSTATLKAGVPLSAPPVDKTDICEYGEALVLFRLFETAYEKCTKNLKRHRFGIPYKLTCSYCKIDLEDEIDAFCAHTISDGHIRNALCTGVSRSEMEYWLPLLECLSQKRRRLNERRQRHTKCPTSLQEDDFPLCYEIGQLEPNDFVYEGAQVAQVLEYTRNHVRLNFPHLDDIPVRTACRWCNTELYSKYGVIRHVLYDKQHTQRLRVVSNDDLRCLYKKLRLHVSIPLFISSRLPELPLGQFEKKQTMQRLTNVMWRRHKQRSIRHLASRTFPVGLVNQCKLCDAKIEHLDAIATHFCSEIHAENVVKGARVAKTDVDYWMKILEISP